MPSCNFMRSERQGTVGLWGYPILGLYWIHTLWAISWGYSIYALICLRETLPNLDVRQNSRKCQLKLKFIFCNHRSPFLGARELPSLHDGRWYPRFGLQLIVPSDFNTRVIWLILLLHLLNFLTIRWRYFYNQYCFNTVRHFFSRVG